MKAAHTLINITKIVMLERGIDGALDLGTLLGSILTSVMFQFQIFW